MNFKELTLEEQLLKIFNHFGEDNQLDKLKEECLELIQEIDFYKKDKSLCNIKKLTYEKFDVVFLLSQFIVKYTEREYYFQKKCKQVIDKFDIFFNNLENKE